MRLWDEFEEIKDLILAVGEASNAFWDFSREVEPRRQSLGLEEKQKKYTLFQAKDETLKSTWKELKKIIKSLVDSSEIAIDQDLHLRNPDRKQLGLAPHGNNAYQFEKLCQQYAKDPCNIAAIDGLERFLDIMVQHYCRLADGWYVNHEEQEAQTRAQGSDLKPESYTERIMSRNSNQARQK